MTAHPAGYVDGVAGLSADRAIEAAIKSRSARRFNAPQNTRNAHNPNSEECEYSETPAWSDPVALGTGTLLPFPTDALPDWTARFVSEVARSTQTPEDLAGVLVLVAISVAVQGKHEVEVRPGYREPLSVFLVVVLPPGSRKSRVFSIVTRPMFDYEQQLSEDAAPEVARRHAERAILEEQVKHVRVKAAREAKPDEQRILMEKARVLAENLESLPELVRPRLLADDITPEKLAWLMSEQGGRMGVMSSEGGIFQMMAGRYSANREANLDVFLKGHSGDPVVVDRSNGRQHHIPNPALSIGLTIQPSVLRGLVGGRNAEFRGRGLLGRFWYSLPPNLLGSRQVDPEPMRADTSSVYAHHLEQLLKVEWATGDHGKRLSHILTFDRYARERLFEYARTVEAKLAPGQGLSNMTDWAGKLVGAVVRLCGLLHLGDGHDANVLIDKSVVGRAVSIGAYLEAHAQAAYFEMGADPMIDDARAVARWIGQNQITSLTQRDVHQAHRARFKTSEAVRPVMKILTEHEYIRPQPQKEGAGPGRKPSPAYDTNPAWLSQNTQNTHNDTFDYERVEHRTIQAEAAL